MKTVEKMIEKMRNNPSGVRFKDCCAVCTHYFGKPRICGSHWIFKTPWIGDPRINIQDCDGRAKPYQVRQVLRAIDKLEGKDDV
ncbi:MAG TPA: toxin HicA [Coriobacteriia bacterium]|nr:toxin HicA [Coriobacteriia bacterium]